MMMSAFLGCQNTPKIHPKFLENFKTDIKKTSARFEGVTSLTYSDKSGYLLIGRESGDIEIWDTKAENSKQIISGAHENRVSTLQFTIDGKYFFSASPFLDAIKLWDVQTNALLHTVPEFRGPMTHTPIDDIYLLAETSSVYFFDAKNKHLIDRRFNTSGGVTSFAIDKKTNFIAVGTASGSIDLFEMLMIDQIPSLKKIKRIKPYAVGEWVIALHFSPDSKSLYSVSRSGEIDEWSIPSFKKIRTLNSNAAWLSNAKFFLDGKFLALVGDSDGGGVSGNSFVEIITLSSGASVMKKMTTNYAQIEYIPPLNQLMAISVRSVIMIDIQK